MSSLSPYTDPPPQESAPQGRGQENDENYARWKIKNERADFEIVFNHLEMIG